MANRSEICLKRQSEPCDRGREKHSAAPTSSAPVAGANEIEIPVTPEVVWDVPTDNEAWPSWNPDVRNACRTREFNPAF